MALKKVSTAWRFLKDTDDLDNVARDLTALYQQADLLCVVTADSLREVLQHSEIITSWEVLIDRDGTADDFFSEPKEWLRIVSVATLSARHLVGRTIARIDDFFTHPEFIGDGGLVFIMACGRTCGRTHSSDLRRPFPTITDLEYPLNTVSEHYATTDIQQHLAPGIHIHALAAST